MAVVGALLALASGRAAPGAAAQPAPATPDDALRELAERLLSTPVPGPPGVDLPPVRLFPGALPPDLPIEPPLPPGARLIGSVVRPVLVGGPLPEVGEAVEVVLDVPESPAATLAFYERAFAERGLSRPAFAGGFRPGGFLPSGGSATFATFCRSEGGPFLEVAAAPRPGRPTDVRLRIQPFPGPCAAPPGPPPPPPGDVLPPLESPAGAVVSPTGGGGSPVSRSSDAIAETELGAAALEAHYARQLAAAGWERTAGAAEGPLAWSVWRVPAGGSRSGAASAAEWQGFLAVLEGPTPTRRTLHLQVIAAGPESFGPGGPTIIVPAPPRP